MCEFKTVIVAQKEEIVISSKATWIQGEPEVKITMPERTYKILVCEDKKWGEPLIKPVSTIILTDNDLQLEAVKAVNDYWKSKADKGSNLINGKSKDDILGKNWEDTLKGKKGKLENETERDRLKNEIDKQK